MKFCAVSFFDYLEALSPGKRTQILSYDDEHDTVDAWLDQYAEISIWHPRAFLFREACLTVLYDLQEQHWSTELFGFPWMREDA
jgi:hypothetical protein